MDPRIRASRKQEAAGKERYGSTQHAGSGSGFLRNDQHTEDLLLEYKTVLGGKKQITIRLDDLLLVERTAAQQGKMPVLQFELRNQRYVILMEDDFLEQRERATESSGTAGEA